MVFLPGIFTNTLAALPDMDLAAFLRVLAVGEKIHFEDSSLAGPGYYPNSINNYYPKELRILKEV